MLTDKFLGAAFLKSNGSAASEDIICAFYGT